MKKDSLGDRMKEYYEDRSRICLTRRTPVIMRLDGRAFHTFTRGITKPFSEELNKCMVETTQFLMKNIQGAKLGYTQSDEISILITDFDKLETEAWFDYNIQKMVSISAAMASVNFTLHYAAQEHGECPSLNEVRHANFDSRVFNIPKEEVNNYFVWRQKDWNRNSVAMLAQAHFSHKELQKQGKADQLAMLLEKKIDWNALDSKWRNGTTIIKCDDSTYSKIPDSIFQLSPDIVEQYLYE